MDYRYLGNSGLKVSVLGFGNMTTGMNFFRGKEDVLDPEIEQNHFLMTERCIKAGINFFDTAEIYGLGTSEVILGRNLKQGNWDRDELIITTKMNPRLTGIQGMSRKRLRSGVAKSLDRMQLDHVDLLYLHRFDYDVPLKESVSVMNECIENDQAFYWGTSEFTPQQLVECHLICEKYGFSPPVVEQCEYNMLVRDVFERDYAPIFDQYHTGTTVWSPICGGLLSGKFNDGNIPEGTRYSGDTPYAKMVFHRKLGWRPNNGSEMLQGLGNIAKELNCTQAQLCLAWVIKNKDVSLALFGASNLTQLEDNIGAVKVVKLLDQNILDRIEALLNNRPAPPTDFRTFTPRAPRR